MNSTERALKRAIETRLECRASIWLVNRRYDEVYCWDRCNSSPGHDGPHQIWSDRYGDTWAVWTDAEVPHSRYSDIEDVFHHSEPSPWKADELEELRRFTDDEEVA